MKTEKLLQHSHTCRKIVFYLNTLLLNFVIAIISVDFIDFILQELTKYSQAEDFTPSDLAVHCASKKYKLKLIIDLTNNKHLADKDRFYKPKVIPTETKRAGILYFGYSDNSRSKFSQLEVHGQSVPGA